MLNPLASSRIALRLTAVDEQRIRLEKRRGFQNQLIRFRLAAQIASLDEYNIELVLVNSHDG